MYNASHVINSISLVQQVQGLKEYWYWVSDSIIEHLEIHVCIGCPVINRLMVKEIINSLHNKTVRPMK